MQTANSSCEPIGSLSKSLISANSIGNNVDFASPPNSPSFPSTPRSPDRPSSPRPSPPRRANTLSKILSNATAPVLNKDTTFAAFKVLPIDPARSRRENGSFFEPADELTGVSNCKEAVDVMVDAIHRACQEAGGARGEFIKQEDVVRCVVFIWDFRKLYPHGDVRAAWLRRSVIRVCMRKWNTGSSDCCGSEARLLFTLYIVSCIAEALMRLPAKLAKPWKAEPTELLVRALVTLGRHFPRATRLYDLMGCSFPAPGR